MKVFFKVSFAAFLIGVLGMFLAVQVKNGEQVALFCTLVGTLGVFGMAISGIVAVMKL